MIEFISATKWYNYTTHAEFNARCSQANVADGIPSAVQNYRLAFMLKKTQR
ncbi:MAG: hypothetical protein MET45_27870 [Nostoc sp. LLA-1]|nr:hypothetical protein [Cyanocohniella sp. LLY]